MRLRLLIAVIALAIPAAASAQAAGQGRGRGAAGPPSPGEVAYGKVCINCHGPAGRGDKGPPLVPQMRSADEILSLVREGYEQMPAVPRTALSDDEIRQIATYLKSLRGSFGEVALGPGPWVYQTAEQKIKLSIIAGGLDQPWSVAWLPDGSMLVTEQAGRLRLIKNGKLDPKPIPGVPKTKVTLLGGLLEVTPHPNFAQNHLLYFAYSKAGDKGIT